jgi:predicted ATP-grasp superfamily ATP-dependent carboligase
MKAIVCGGRNYADGTNTNKFISQSKFEIKCVYRVLSYLINIFNITEFAHGGARGVDSCAHVWGVNNNMPPVRFSANWTKYNTAAELIRNTRMLKEYQPDIGISFVGDFNTADMTRKLKEKFVPVLEISQPINLTYLSISRAVWNKQAQWYYYTMAPYISSVVDWTDYHKLTDEYVRDYWRAHAQIEFMQRLQRLSL